MTCYYIVAVYLSFADICSPMVRLTAYCWDIYCICTQYPCSLSFTRQIVQHFPIIGVQ